jgi:hypothetical protein
MHATWCLTEILLSALDFQNAALSAVKKGYFEAATLYWKPNL